jgi:hypothetical protein
VTRRLIANMDAETRWVGRDRLPRALRERLAAAGTLMRAFAEEGDELWTVGPMADDALPEVPGLPRPRLVSGPFVDDGVPLLSWMVTPDLPGADAGAPAAPGAPDGVPSWGMSPEGVVERVAHRAFAHDLARRLGLGHAGSHALVSAQELEEVLTGALGPWVLKPGWSAAGRGHLLSDGPADPVTRLSALRLLKSQGWLLFEPWDTRVLDVGCCGLVSERGASLVGSHRLLIDEGGRFRGVVTTADGVAPGLQHDESEALQAATLAAGSALSAAGYSGPFGVDAYRTAEGTFRPLVEVNARLSFGLITRLLAERVEAVDHRAPVALRMARGPVPEGEGIVPLLHPDPDHAEGGTSAWLEPWAED